MARALGYGLGAAILTGLGFAVVGGVLDLPVALPVIAGFGGLFIGFSVRRGAWSGARHVPSRSVVLAAICLALLAWLGGEFGAYLFALLLRPDSALTFAERLAGESFMDWLGPQFGPLEIIELFLLGGIARYAAR